MILQNIQQIEYVSTYFTFEKLAFGYYSGFKCMYAGIISLQINNKSESINTLEKPKLAFGHICKCKLIYIVCVVSLASEAYKKMNKAEFQVL